MFNVLIIMYSIKCNEIKFEFLILKRNLNISNIYMYIDLIGILKVYVRNFKII